MKLAMQAYLEVLFFGFTAVFDGFGNGFEVGDGSDGRWEGGGEGRRWEMGWMTPRARWGAALMSGYVPPEHECRYGNFLGSEHLILGFS